MNDYAVEIRRRLHRYPEIGFHLPRTLELVRTELTRFSIPFTEAYGKSSIVGIINPEKKHFTIGLRADLDALPITEQTGLPYKSQLEGQMHACGHDAHTAILLDAARRLSAIREELDCRVMLVFQAAEEYAPGGARLMAEDGLMDGIDCIAALHCDTRYPCGQIALSAGPQNAISHGFTLDFYGRSAHAAKREEGIDAIMMAVHALTAIETAMSQEGLARERTVFNAGSIHGGKSNNSVCDFCSVYCTLRCWNGEDHGKIQTRIEAILAQVAAKQGGRAELTTKKLYPVLINEDAFTDRLYRAAQAVVGEGNIFPNIRSMGGEDFAFFAQRKPAAMFRLGVRSEEKGCVYSTHQDRFDLDEDALQVGSDIFVTFVRQNAGGLG